MIVRAPATSANLGPGFDCAAVALDLWNELEVTDGDREGVSVEIEGEGAGELPENATNLGVRAFALAASPEGKRFRFVNRIPLARGLGSSAAAIAAGLAAAAPGRPPEELLGLGVSLEGHADNLAAALAGGVTLAVGGRIVRLADALPLSLIAVVPAERTSTAASRRSLPQVVPHVDAAQTAAFAALLGAGIGAGDADLLAAGLNDRLHEPYRASPLLDELRSYPPQGAAGATLSGSGPTVLVWAHVSEVCVSALRARYPDHLVLPLAVAERGAA